MQRKFVGVLFTVAIIASILVVNSEAGRLRRQSETKNCGNFCTFQFDPVCGKSSNPSTYRTFPNRCAFDNQQCLNSDWTFVQKGECPYKL